MSIINFAQLVIGPAGSGKSTYCRVIQEHGQVIKRQIRVINMDPAADTYSYNCAIDIRDLIKVEKVMANHSLGPNGALVKAMEGVLKRLDWLIDRINDFGDNNYFLFDCPGQLELYSHYPLMKEIVTKLTKIGINFISVFCLDATFLQGKNKFISGSVLSLATMIQMELPNLNILTKADLVKDKDLIDGLLDVEALNLREESKPDSKMAKLDSILLDLIDSYSMLNYVPLDVGDEDSIATALLQADMMLQYLENQEPNENMIPEGEVDEDN